MTRSSAGAVELRDLTDAPELDGLAVLHLVSERSPVKDLALVTDFEDIGAVGPDTVVLLSPGGAKGGWMISAALRYAWERRVCALIVPEQPFTASVIELASRLEVSLFATRLDMTRLALDVATRIGVARAESATRVRAAVGRLAELSDPSEAMRLLSDELDGAPVWIESAGVPTYSARPEGASPGSRRTGSVRIALSPRAPERGALCAEVPPTAAALGEELLTAAAPALRALLLDLRLAAELASLPPIAVAMLTGSPAVTAFDPPPPPGGDGCAPPFEGGYLAVCLLADDPERIGSAAHQLWHLACPETPLTRIEGGWLAFLSVGEPERRSVLLERLRDRIALPVAIGVSRIGSGPERARASVREAWLAARMAAPVPNTSVRAEIVDFDRMPARLIGRLVPADLARQILDALLPALMADPAAESLIDAVLAYLAAHGSISGAAARLGVHRNTLQARLRRAQDLGAELSDPDGVLPTHLLLAAARAADPGPLPR